jgi:hypothetical protein
MRFLSLGSRWLELRGLDMQKCITINGYGKHYGRKHRGTQLGLRFVVFKKGIKRLLPQTPRRKIFQYMYREDSSSSWEPLFVRES